MATPSLSLTFQDLIIRVAEYLGIAYYGPDGTEAAQLPVDPHDLELCKRLVNDGYRRFLTGNPRWQFLTPTIQITFVPGQAEYDMPDGFYGSILMPWTYPPNGPHLTISTVSEGAIREMQAGGDVSGDPAYVAFRPKAVDAATDGARWQAIFWPTPAAEYTVTARARLFPDKLVDLTDRPVAGFQHDEAILAAALMEAERQRGDGMGVQAQNYADALKRAMEQDKQAAPKRLGDYGDRSEDRLRAQRPYTGVDTYNNVPV